MPGEGDAGAGGGNEKAAKQAALYAKVVENYGLLLKTDFGKDVAYTPSLDTKNPSFKSFTAYPYEQGKSQNGIGVLFYRPAFYVRHAKIINELKQVLNNNKDVTGEVTYNSGNGCSLGWTRFKNVRQVYLSLKYRIHNLGYIHVQNTACHLRFQNMCMCMRAKHILSLLHLCMSKVAHCDGCGWLDSCWQNWELGFWVNNGEAHFVFGRSRDIETHGGSTT